MIEPLQPIPGAPPPPTILVVDDDRRVLELLEVALTANGYRVLTAADGDEAIKRALGDRPDLIVLDVRLPKKSGFEVCEYLRNDPEDPFVPIVLVSAAVETETRLQAFRRGADDYLSKPFSPRELVARVRRLITRSAEAAASRRRARGLEHELARLREELRRAHAQTERAERLREVAFGLGGDLHRSRDLDEFARRFLAAVQSRLGVGTAALLLPGSRVSGLRERIESEGGARAADTRVGPASRSGSAGGFLEPVAVRGDGLERVAGLAIACDGEIAALVAGLGRPVTRRELERRPELRAETARLVASGITLVAPLCGPGGLEGLVVADEPLSGAEPAAAELDLLRCLCDIAAVALQNGLRHRDQIDSFLELLAERTRTGSAPAALEEEAASLADRAARACLLPARERGLLRHALAIGRWGMSPEGRRALEHVGEREGSGLTAELVRLIAGASALEFDPEGSPDERRASLITAVASDYLAARVRGLRPPEALAHGLLLAGEQLDSATARALKDALADIPPEEAVNAGADPGAAAREGVAGAAEAAGCEGAAEDTGREGESGAAEDAGSGAPTSGSR